MSTVWPSATECHPWRGGAALASAPWWPAAGFGWTRHSSRHEPPGRVTRNPGAFERPRALCTAHVLPGLSLGLRTAGVSHPEGLSFLGSGPGPQAPAHSWDGWRATEWVEGVLGEELWFQRGPSFPLSTDWSTDSSSARRPLETPGGERWQSHPVASIDVATTHMATVRGFQNPSSDLSPLCFVQSPKSLFWVLAVFEGCVRGLPPPGSLPWSSWSEGSHPPLQHVLLSWRPSWSPPLCRACTLNHLFLRAPLEAGPAATPTLHRGKLRLREVTGLALSHTPACGKGTSEPRAL